MATTGSERGLTLRSPGRFLATASRLRRALAGALGATEPTRAARRTSSQAWMDAEAYRLYTLATSPASIDGASLGARVEPQQGVLVRARRAPARDRARAARAADGREAPTASTGLDEGLPVRAVGPDLRRHQRDPAQRDRRARARPAEEVGEPMRFAFTDDQLAVPRRRPRAARQGVPARASCATRWASATGGTRRACGRARRDGRARRARARGARRARARPSSTSCCCSRRPAAPRCPSRSSRRRGRRAAAGRRRSRRRRGGRGCGRVAVGDRARADRRAVPRTPTRADLVLVERSDGALHAVEPRPPARARAAAVGRRLAAGCSPSTATGVGAAVAPVDAAARGARPGPSTAARWRRRRSCSGSADRMLDLTVEYVEGAPAVRRPIGSFQAVKHHLADALLALEFARPLVYRAACSLADGDPTPSGRTSRWPRPWRRTPPPSPPARRCSATAPSATPSSTTCTCG